MSFKNQRVLGLPLVFTLVLAALAFIPSVHASPGMFWAFLGAAGVLLVWNAALLLSAARGGRTLGMHYVLRRPHWVQPLVQGTIYVYWGWYSDRVYAAAWIILAQIVFAYAFNTLLCWSRRDEQEVGFGIVPIILSMNLFLWFKPDWFYWQFLMVALAFAAKEFLRWQKDGQSVHIFNPSSFPLAILSLGLILTGTADHTWGNEIANSLSTPPYIYELLFLVSIPGQLLFGVATMTMPAVLTSFLLGAAYTSVTGTYYYFGPIPTAAFLGMLLLFTDPSTAPRSELGRVLFGVLYGASVFVLYGLLDYASEFTFYDKLLFVPFLNLSVRGLDRLAASPALARLDPTALLRKLTVPRRNAAATAVWAGVFVCLLAVHGVGAAHPANRLPLWRQACAEKLRNGCRNLETMETLFCQNGSPWACSDLALRILEGPVPPGDESRATAIQRLDRACTLGSQAGCANARMARTGAGSLLHEPPEALDYDLILEDRGYPKQRTNLQLLTWACEQGWQEGCASLQRAPQQAGGAQQGSPLAQERARGCSAGDKGACRALGLQYRLGDGVPRDERRALACELGLAEACVGAAR